MKKKRKIVEPAPPPQEPDRYIVDHALLQAALDVIVTRPFSEVYQVVGQIRSLTPLPKTQPEEVKS